MLCCSPPQPIVSPSEKAFSYARTLKIVMICELMLAVLYLSSSSFSYGIYELILVYILWKSVSSFNYCSMVIYQFIILTNLLTNACNIGNYIQHGFFFTSKLCLLYSQTLDCNLGYRYFGQLVTLIGICFYIVVLILAFYAYREFKALFIEQALGVQAPRYDEEQQRPAANVRQNTGNNVRAFQGRGVAIGQT